MIEKLKAEIDERESKIKEDIEKYQKKCNALYPNIDKKVDDIVLNIDQLENITEDEVNKYLPDIMSYDEKRYMLMRKTLNNLKITKPDITLIEYVDLCTNIFNVFKANKITRVIEDDEWVLHDHYSTKYQLFDGEIIFENTVSLAYITDKIMITYLNNILELLDQINENIIVNYKVIRSEGDGIAFVIIRAKLEQ